MESTSFSTSIPTIEHVQSINDLQHFLHMGEGNISNASHIKNSANIERIRAYLIHVFRNCFLFQKTRKIRFVPYVFLF